MRRYCHQVIEALETGKITYVAHPDLINFVGDPKVYQRHMRDLCRAAKETATPLEINLLGQFVGKHYPNGLLWEVAAEEGCQCVLGLDAHSPDHIRNLEPEQTALKMVERLGLDLLETVNLKSI